jgi:HlyD family secretion protein
MAGEIVFYKNIIENMQEGVMTLDLKGKITMFNDAAAMILGLSQEEIIHQPFGMAFMMEMEGNDEFNQAILDAVYKSAVGQEETLGFKRPDGTLIQLSMTTSYLKSDQAQDPSGVIVVFNDITEILNFQENEKQLNRQLQNAVLEAEQTNSILTSALKKVQVIRIAIILMIFLGISGSGFYLWHMDFLSQSLFTTAPPSDQEDTPQGMQQFTVSKQAIANFVSLSGYVAPLEEINVVAPFDGKIKNKFFVYDQRTEQGEALLEMDSSKLKISLRELTSSHIKTRRKYNEVANWEKSSEVSSAKRSFTKAKNSLETSKRKLKETDLLFKKGIIPASEFESAKIALFNENLDFAAAQEALDGVIKKGNKENRDIAKFELTNAEVNLKEIKDKLAHATVYSSVSGIVIQPTQSGEAKNKSIEPGISVTQGEILFTIGNLEGLSIKAKVDEIDIGKIQFDQKVTVQGDAFANIPLIGRVSHISSNAVTGQSQAPTFDVTVSIDSLTPAQKKQIKLGMSTNLEIMVYQNPSALLIPLDAVEIRDNKKWVTIMDKGKLTPLEVTTGMTTINSVEILEGLKENDTIYYQPGLFVPNSGPQF